MRSGLPVGSFSRMASITGSSSEQATTAFGLRLHRIPLQTCIAVPQDCKVSALSGCHPTAQGGLPDSVSLLQDSWTEGDHPISE